MEAEEQDPFSPSPPLDAFASLKLSTTSSNIPSSTAPSISSGTKIKSLTAVPVNNHQKDHSFNFSAGMNWLETCMRYQEFK